MIEWREADAGALPFADEAFDAVLCQLGLQFFSARAAALCELYRVLRTGGLLVLMVWRPIDRSPGFRALAEALERHIGPDTASIMRAPFALGDVEELTSLLAAAGFEDLDLRTEPALCASPPWRSSWRATSSARRSRAPSQPPLQMRVTHCLPKSHRGSSHSSARPG